MQERLTGVLQEVRVNRNLTSQMAADLQAFVEDPATRPFPMLRFRNTATGDYWPPRLSSPACRLM